MRNAIGKLYPKVHLVLSSKYGVPYAPWLKCKGRGRSFESFGFNFYTDGGESIELLQFKFDVIRVATENFSEANKTRGDGINFIYKGTLQNGQVITVKQFHFYSMRVLEECRNEVSLLVNLEHEILLQLLVYCLKGEKLFLIYDFALYTSLDCLISDPVMHTDSFDWSKCYKIILGVAKGLLYLHKHAPIPIVHCDVNPGNILLDGSFDPKISHFGLATSLARDDIYYDEEYRVAGTFEYMAPEYLNGHVSTKVDVFSFGMLALEIIRGRKYGTFFSIIQEELIERTWKNWHKGTSSTMTDTTMDIDSSSLTRCIQIGMLCVQPEAAERPTMDEVVEMLISSSSLTFPFPKDIAYWYYEMLINDYHVYDSMATVDSHDYDSGAIEEFMSELCSR